MLQSILKGLALGAFVAIAPVAAFLLWRSAAWWLLLILACAFALILLIGVGEAMGWRWARAMARLLMIG